MNDSYMIGNTVYMITVCTHCLRYAVVRVRGKVTICHRCLVCLPDYHHLPAAVKRGDEQDYERAGEVLRREPRGMLTAQDREWLATLECP